MSRYLARTRVLTPNAFTFQKALEALHPNIACMRHPDHIGSKGA
jgi:phospholipase D1/2